jgi:cytochrome c oxidase cbb3-type subunit IV
MSYDSIADASSMLGLLFFFMLFACILVWALRPKNKARFDAAARIPLEEPESVDINTKNLKP